MELIELVLMAIGLSMDAFAVCLTNGVVYPKNTKVKSSATALSFGVFQGVMPFLGCYLGGVFAYYISKYAGIVILIILGFVGGKMIYEGLSQKEEQEIKGQISWTEIIVQSIATSIDAFAVGVGFCVMDINIVSACCIIAAITASLSLLAVYMGKRFGDMLGNKAEILGGVILVSIGIKALIF